MTLKRAFSACRPTVCVCVCVRTFAGEGVCEDGRRMDFNHCLEKNGILSFLRCEDHSALAQSPGSIAKKMCFKIVLKS